MTGSLYIVSTPIGNREDISARALQVLDSVDVIAAEDTRHSGQLLSYLGIATPTLSYHDHNEAERTPELLRRLIDGESVALISDAGTPLVSDPGYRLVRAARAEAIPVVPIPGASALLAALVVAGLPSDRFVFQGFLPPKGAGRDRAVESLVRQPCTAVVYESPRRIGDLLQRLEEQLEPGRELVLCRELTKRFETVLAGSVGELRQRLEEDANQRKGEFVLVLAEAPDEEVGDEQLRALAEPLLRELPASRAARVLAAWTGRKRQEIYRWLESLGG